MWSNLLTFKSSIRMGKKGVLSDFECGLIFGSRCCWSRVYREWCEKEKISSQQQRTGRLLQDLRKATVILISTQPINAEYHLLTHAKSNLVEDGCSSRRPYQCHSWQWRTGKWGYNLNSFTKIGEWKTGNLLPGLRSRNFSCDISDGLVRIRCNLVVVVV